MIDLSQYDLPSLFWRPNNRAVDNVNKGQMQHKLELGTTFSNSPERARRNWENA